MKIIQYVIAASILIAATLAGLHFLGADNTGADADTPAGQANQTGAQTNAAPRQRGRPASLVVPATVSAALINDRLKAVGNGTARASVSVVPLSDGLLAEVLVTPGQQVTAGDVLARLDDQEERIARDRAARALDEARRDLQRLEQLYRSRTTTAVERDRARATLNDAELALQDAQLRLSRRTLTAPISGVVGFIAVDTGNYVTTQTELMTIDDRSTIIVEFWVPERFASQIKLGQTVTATALSAPAIRHEGELVGIGSRIETDSRTLPVEALLNNDDDRLRPGMSFDLELTFDGDLYPAVSPLAIQWDSNGSFVWKMADDKVQRLPVRIIQRNADSVLVDAELKVGDQVVREGVLSLRNGAAVRVQGQAPRDT